MIPNFILFEDAPDYIPEEHEDKFSEINWSDQTFTTTTGTATGAAVPVPVSISIIVSIYFFLLSLDIIEFKF